MDYYDYTFDELVIQRIREEIGGTAPLPPRHPPTGGAQQQQQPAKQSAHARNRARTQQAGMMSKS